MLIITRRAGESIHIGDEITVEILDIKGNQTRIGITAPTQIKVHREEVYRRIKNQMEKQVIEKVS